MTLNTANQIISRVVAVLSLFLVTSGCSRQEDRTPIVIKIGMADTGRPFFDWEEKLTFKTTSNGSAQRPSGAKAQASFSRASWKSSADIDLTINDPEGGSYSIEGTIMSPAPIRLELLGTSPSEQEPNAVIAFPAGTSKVHYEGKLQFTYARRE